MAARIDTRIKALRKRVRRDGWEGPTVIEVIGGYEGEPKHILARYERNGKTWRNVELTAEEKARAWELTDG
jgi:hypothetical protein